MITTNTVTIMMDRDASSPATNQGGSALQNPDLSRAALASMLRRGGKPASGTKQKAVFWSSFLSYYATSCANSNG